MPYCHVPVMLNEVVHYLNCEPGKIYVDCTLGGSGHSRAILEKIMPDGLLIGIDQDEAAINNAKKNLKLYEKNIRLFHCNFIHISDILSELGVHAADGILLDLGVSFHQISSSGRGFSFQKDEPLDMRMGTETTTTKAEDLVNGLKAADLEKIFKEYGEERWSKRIAKKIVTVRKNKKIRSSRELSQIVCEAVPKGNKEKIHPATRVFMALRIAVNKELECLNSFMEAAPALLKPGGRLCILSFHSLEDRIVKHAMKAMEKGCICPPSFPKCVCNKKSVAHILTKKPQRPTKAEVTVNPMSRSTKLRAVEKL
ncbi:Ribosomal RNA small subunit methyltransferase H [Desulfonema magnum]|uniref:Ribosomal RNA small subunit methyltransferase H n=2 Tax=Desulfonema magnum TaxID=45655 RepID=A0A975BEI1_9BACT|nr:16S rRNA (cytosine(1402)-N(4))-methyltransferase RsmH [Desulfonema magnum]QTA84052.1 Ribosomal RNA small subunit methyltransferase H [Desulfonema magnum]